MVNLEVEGVKCMNSKGYARGTRSIMRLGRDEMISQICTRRQYVSALPIVPTGETVEHRVHLDLLKDPLRRPLTSRNLHLPVSLGPTSEFDHPPLSMTALADAATVLCESQASVVKAGASGSLFADQETGKPLRKVQKPKEEKRIHGSSLLCRSTAKVVAVVEGP